MGRRAFSREFKLEAMKLVRERGVSQAQAARDLDLHPNVLRKWVKDFAADPQQAFPGRGNLKPDDAEMARLKRELATRAERDILKKSDRLLCERAAVRCARRSGSRVAGSTSGWADFTSLAATDGFVELPPGPNTHPKGFVTRLHRW